MRQRRRDEGLHRGITFHAMPVAGIGGLLLTAAIILMGILGFPVAKWFLVASIPVGVLALVVIRLFHRLRPKTEEEEIQLKVGRQDNNRNP